MTPYLTSLTTPDIGHGWAAMHSEYDGGAMDGFFTADGINCMGYYTGQDLPFYYSLFSDFTLCGNYFCSVMGPTYPNRFYLVAGTSGGITTNGIWGFGVCLRRSQPHPHPKGTPRARSRTAEAGKCKRRQPGRRERALRARSGGHHRGTPPQSRRVPRRFPRTPLRLPSRPTQGPGKAGAQPPKAHAGTTLTRNHQRHRPKHRQSHPAGQGGTGHARAPFGHGTATADTAQG
ncbi:MAG TPA: alkaline phosphatase family protein [Streptosporangiaceae bacterium]